MRFRDWLRARPRGRSVGDGLGEARDLAAVRPQPVPTIYNGRYSGSSVPERVKAPLPPGASVIDDTIAEWLKREGIAP